MKYEIYLYSYLSSVHKVQKKSRYKQQQKQRIGCRKTKEKKKQNFVFNYTGGEEGETNKLTSSKADV